METKHAEILDRYRSLLSLSEQMVEHAESGDWDSVVDLKSRHLSEVESLIVFESDVTVTDSFREAKLALLRNLHQSEQRLRSCLEERMTFVSNAIAQAKNGQRVAQAYGGGVAAS